MNEQVTEPCQLHPPALGDAKLKFRTTPGGPALFTRFFFFLQWVFADAHMLSLAVVGGDSSLVAVGGDFAPVAVGGDPSLVAVGGDSSPVPVGGDSAPVVVGGDSSLVAVPRLFTAGASLVVEHRL